MPTYLILNACQGITHPLATHLLARPSTTLIPAVRTLTQAHSDHLLNLPKHPTSLTIPAKIDLFSVYDAAGVAKVLHFAGVGRLDGVVIPDLERGHGALAGEGGGYANGVLRLVQKFGVLLADDARIILLGKGLGVQRAMELLVDEEEREPGCRGSGGRVVLGVDVGKGCAGGCVSEEKSVEGIVRLLDHSTAKDKGRFLSCDGEEAQLLPN